jgi:hypothetical protein
MNLLFLHPTPGLGRQRAYFQACQLLTQSKAARCVFVYNGPECPGLDGDVPVYHFDSWVAQNTTAIQVADIDALERKYAKSNLWLAAVSERQISNYSLLNGSYRTIRYSQAEQLHLLKALVLFFEHVIKAEQIDAILAHHPDNIFSTMLFEMCESRVQVPFLLFPDYYWQQDRYLAFDSKYFTSARMTQRYHDLYAQYDTQVAPRMAEAEAYLAPRRAKDPSVIRKDLLPKLTLGKNLRNAVATFRAKKGWISLRRPDVLKAHSQSWLPVLLRAFLTRNMNLIGHQLSRHFLRDMPTGPYVYLPLQRVPEAAMLTRSTGYLNQLSLVQVLSASLPSGYTLVVKDHPKSRGYHPTSYYRAMSDLPNVVVMDDTFPNDGLLEGANLIVTVGGTLGMQQLFTGKPILMFGRKYYEVMEGVMRVRDLNDLPYRLKDILVNGVTVERATCERSLHAFVLALIDCSYIVADQTKTLHQNPEALAQLVADILATEITDMVSTKRAAYAVAQDAPTPAEAALT